MPTRPTTTRKQRQRGLSLVELMVSLAVTSILMAGLIEVYVGVRRTEMTQEGLSHIQESGRFAMYFLTESAQMTGYVGCLSGMSTDEVTNLLDAPPASFQPEIPIQGWEADDSAPGEISNVDDGVEVVSTGGGDWSSSGGNVLEDTNVVPGTDILRIWGIDSAQEADINTITPGLATVVNTDVFDVEDGDILLLSDCEQANIVQACEVQTLSSPASLNLTLSALCAPGNNLLQNVSVSTEGKAARLTGTLYYIGKRGDDADNSPSLFQRQLSSTGALGPAEELVEGVANMQVLYGENLDNDSRNAADAYVTADQVADWDNVVSIRISLLVESIEAELLEAPQAFTFNGVVYDGEAGNGDLPDDQRSRRVFTTTLSLRNKVL